MLALLRWCPALFLTSATCFVHEECFFPSIHKASLGFFFLINYSFFVCAGSSMSHGLFSRCGKWGSLFVAVVHLIVVASPVSEHGL